VISDGIPSEPRRVREAYGRLKPLQKVGVRERGWTLDVLRAVESIRKKEFSLPEIYAFEDQLQQLHPDNRHVRPKIRQQLQILRDKGLLEFLGGGTYRLRE
jgi:type II restriction enzyme